MKKDYIKPYMVIVDIKGCEDIMQSSYVDVGGTTNYFNARRRKYHDIWDEWEDE